MSAPKSSLATIDSLLSGIKQRTHAPSSTKSDYRKKKLMMSKPETVRAFDYRNQLIVASQFVLSRVGTAPIAIVLGSGLGGFSKKLHDVQELPYEEIPFLPIPTVKGHSGKIIMGYLQSKDQKMKKRIMCFSGRLHSYEGYPMYQVTFCARLSYLCGVHTLILTNAAGGCIPNQKAGSVIILTDYIRDVNYTVLGHSANDQMFGVRHMKCDKLLDRELSELFINTAKHLSFPYHVGTYWWCMGPCYETASQIRFAIKTGAQCVGMSTVPSILAAKNIGLRVAALSLCTNVAAGLEDEELDHAIVMQNAITAAIPFSNYIEQTLLIIDDPNTYDSYQYAASNNPAASNLHDLKLNLSSLAMNIDTTSFDEYIFPRKHIGTYDELYKDISFVRKFLSNILDLRINTQMDISALSQSRSTSNVALHSNIFISSDKDNNNDEMDIGKPGTLLSTQSLPDHQSLIIKQHHHKQFQPPIDFAPESRGSTGHILAPHTHHQYHHLTQGKVINNVENIQNRDGPIPIWILHDPFKFDTTTLQCPISIPLKTLWGFGAISKSSSARNAILNFGFDQHYNLIVVIVGLSLGGFSFDESNYIINLLYGVLGHKNLYFTNMFYAFPTKTMYSNDEKDDEEKCAVPRGQYALIKDSVDFAGGFPRFPRPLFPPKEINTSDCYVRMKYGVFGNTKTTDSQVECLKGFKGFFDDLNSNKKTNIYSYAYWPGPNFPTLAELNISDIAGCELTGISNPFMTPMSRQLGHDGYSVAFVGTRKEFEGITASKGKSIHHNLCKNVTNIVFSISSSIITFFKSSPCLFSPASMNSNKPSIFHASSITDDRLHSELSGINVPYKAPQYQVFRKIDDEWSFINEAVEWLGNVWNFEAHPVQNALFSTFSHVVDPSFADHYGDKQESNQSNIGGFSKRGLVSINLSNIPGWREHFCGGFPYSHYHWNNDNPFEWTLKIFRYDIDSFDIATKDKKGRRYSNEQHPTYYIVVAPHFFTNTKLHPQRYAYITSFYKYTPRFWNLSFIVRVLWKLGVKNVCFLSHLIGNNCDENINKEEFKTLHRNSVVIMNNYIECARWNILTGPNDDRIGPRFVPITDPVELEDDFIKIVESKKFRKKIQSVITVHVPSTATISESTSSFYGKLGYQTRVLGLIPCIQTAQHLGLKKLCVGITDYTIDEKLQNVESFNEIVKMIEILFSSLEPEEEQQTQWNQ